MLLDVRQIRGNGRPARFLSDCTGETPMPPVQTKSLPAKGRWYDPNFGLRLIGRWLCAGKLRGWSHERVGRGKSLRRGIDGQKESTDPETWPHVRNHGETLALPFPNSRRNPGRTFLPSFR